MSLFQSSAQGMISLIEDRETDFSQELSVRVSRYSIVIGKVCGETLVGFIGAMPTIAFGLLVRVPLSPAQVAWSSPVLFGPATNLGLMLVMFAGFLVLGTATFVRSETNR